MANEVIPVPSTQRIIRLEEGCRAIAEAKNIEDVKTIRDTAELIRIAARERDLGMEAQNDAAEIKVRAERRMGELLKDGPQQKGRPSKMSQDATLLPEGVTRSDSSRCQTIADLPEEEFEEEVKNHREGGRLTSSAIHKAAKTHKRKEAKKQKLENAPPMPEGVEARVIVGDCVKELRKLKEKPRLIFADPPYNVGVDYGSGASADKLPEEKFVSWCRAWIEACRDALADDGTLWVMISDEFAAEIAVELKDAGLHRRAWVKWYETFGVCNSSGSNFSRTSRHLFYCVKNTRKYCWNPEAVTRPSDRQTKYDDARADPGGKVWDDVWQIPRLVGTSKERIDGFPTQLPLEILTPIVGATSDVGDLVVDPFCGSGTTGAASVKSGRRFVGIEKSKEFARLATLRLQGESDG